MTLLPWILFALLLFVLVLLVTPVVVDLDTRSAHAELRWGWIGDLRVQVDEGPLRYRARVLFIRWTRPIRSGQPVQARVPVPSKKEGAKAKRKNRSFVGRRWVLRAAWKVFRATRVRRFHLVLDTDDVVLNAWLFPVFHLMRLRGMDVEVRFSGGSELAATISHSPARMLWAMLRV